MKIFIDWLKKAITKIEHDNELYVGNQFSNKFDVYFFNVGTDTDWFPTLTQLAPNGRETGPFTADSDSFTTTTIDNVTYLTATFTMGTGYAFIKGVSSFFLYENRITTPHQTKSVIGKFIVTLNKSDEGYFLDDPEFNPKVKEYVDKYSQLRFGGEASTSVIEALTTNQGVWLATDTGYYWYWDYDNNEYVRGNLFQAVSVADGAITNAKIANGAVTGNKLASAVRTRVDNSIQNGENNPTAASNVHTNITNSNSMESDTDESYGSQVDLTLDKANVEHSYYSNGTSKHSKIEFDEYHDSTANEDYPRTVIETEYSESATPENSKITILKDLIELLSGGKIELKKGDSRFKIYKNSNNKDVVEFYSKNNVNIDGKEWAHLGTNGYEINVLENSGFYLTILNDTVFFCNTSGFRSNVPFYYNNKELSTKEYVLQREAYLQEQIDDIEVQTNVVNKSDIANNLTTNDSTKVLSASQGVVLKQLIDNINILLQSDDTTLDEIQEIVDYIKNNKSLIDGITTSKVNVSDIINNLTSTATNKPLSAAQGKALKDTLDSVQASISALTSNKQDKIDSSHKLDADLVSDTTSSNKFVSAYLKSLITTNRQDINLLDGRVTNLENNPTSNVSGTNDGTNWTSITIGNETYAIPSGSGGGSGETLVSITLTNLDVRTMESDAERIYDMHIFCTKTRWDSFVALASSVMQIDVTYDNVGTFFTNASQQQQIIFIGYLLMDNFDKKILPQSYVCKQQTVGGVTLTDYQTFASADSFIQDGVEFLYDLKFEDVEISNLDRGNVEYATSNTTVTATEFTSSVGGGSSSSESYYKIVLNDDNMRLISIIYKDDFADILTAINTQMGTSLSTPQDLIDAYNTMKGDSSNVLTLAMLFTAIGQLSCESNLNCVVVKQGINNYKITGYGDIGLEYTTNGTHGLFNSSEEYYIAFTSSSTLTITEQNNQKI